MKCKIAILATIAALLSITNVAAEEIKECQTEKCVKYFKKFKKGAKYGYVQANASLGQFYYIGYGTDKDEDKALKYLKRAAIKGEFSSQYLVGVISLISKENKNIDRAIKYLTKVAKGNYKDSNFLLGTLYINDKLVPKNMEKADLYLAKAYKQKDKRMPKFLESIQDSLKNNAESFPKLTAMMNKKPMVKKESGLAFEKSQYEIITVSSAPLTTIFDEQILTFRKRKKTTGSKLQGKTCGESVGCYQAKLNGQPLNTFFNITSGNAYSN